MGFSVVVVNGDPVSGDWLSALPEGVRVTESTQGGLRFLAEGVAVRFARWGRVDVRGAREEARGAAEEAWGEELPIADILVNVDRPTYIAACGAAALVPRAIVHRGKWQECPKTEDGRWPEPWEPEARVWADRVWEIYGGLRPDDLVSVYTCERVAPLCFIYDRAHDAGADATDYIAACGKRCTVRDRDLVLVPSGTVGEYLRDVARFIPDEATCPECRRGRVDEIRQHPRPPNIWHLRTGRRSTACGALLDEHHVTHPQLTNCPRCVDWIAPDAR